MKNLEQISTLFLNTSSFLYLLAAIFFFILLSKRKESPAILFSSQSLVWVAFGLHTLGLFLRWYLGGIHRPPWTNLYESLVFFAWGPALIQIISQKRWKFPLLGAVLMPLVFLIMGMAVMSPNKEIEPLIPALQSNWLKIHVIFGMLSYAAFTVSACFAFLALIRNGFSLSKLGAVLAIVSSFNVLLLGGKDLWRTGEFRMTQTAERKLANGKTIHVQEKAPLYKGGPVQTKTQKIPGAQIPFYASVFLFLFSAILLYFRRKEKPFQNKSNPSIEEAFESSADLSGFGAFVFDGAQFSLTLLLGIIFYQSQQMTSLSLSSNPYLLMLLLTTLFFNLFFYLGRFRLKNFLKNLPNAERLDELSYVNILWGFPFQTLLLITGAIWAYYAWGRSWGWDPKEIGALITWMVYLLYLHGKLLFNWKKNTLSLIAILGFVVLVFAFLGVNLVLSGLHSYGSA